MNQVNIEIIIMEYKSNIKYNLRRCYKLDFREFAFIFGMSFQ